VDLPELERAVLKSRNKISLRLDPRFPPVLSVKSRTSQSSELSLTLKVRESEKKGEISTEIKQRISTILETIKKSRS